MAEENAVVVAPSALPVFGGEAMSKALVAYKDLQGRIDAAMPDQIISIQGKPFRCKGYWRAVKVAFNLQVLCIKEERETVEDDWGFMVTYRATAPNGSAADGDGACFASEKGRGRMAITVHNVRSHAHTRAMNRAISNLVGFGEVSADELQDEDLRKASRPAREAPKPPSAQGSTAGGYDPKGDTRPVTEAQIRRLYAMQRKIEAKDSDMSALVRLAGKAESSKQLTREGINDVFGVLDLCKCRDDLVAHIDALIGEQAERDRAESGADAAFG